MNTYNSDDEDGTESSIYDLDSAPPLPSGHNAHLHPDSSGPSSPIRRPRWSTAAPSMNNAAPARRRAHTSSVLPGRRSSFASATSPTATRSPSPVIKLPSARSFPPPHSSKASHGKQVAFANSRDSDDAMLHIPEIDNDDDLLDEDDIIDEVDEANARKQQYRDTHSSVDYSQSSAATADDSTTSTRNKYVTICGYTVPTCWCFQEISWNRTAIAVVNKAPCFGCTSMLHHTYRSVLVRLNILCAFFATGQVVSTVWFYIIMQSPLSSVDRDVANQTELETRRRQNEFEVLTNVWNINGSVWFLGVLALIVLVSIGLTIRVIRNVNLVGVVRFLWVILWVLPLQAVMVVGLFDYFLVTQVWIKYWWRDRTMAWFRHRFCEPREFANTLCAVPIYGSEDEEREWCLEKYNATNCSEIRDEAQDGTRLFLFSFYYGNAAWAICFTLLLFLVVKTLESIISRPLVQKAKESNVPAWLFLPIACCGIYGALYAFSSTSGLSTRSRSGGRSEASWIGPLFMAAGAMLAWFLGSFSILNTSDKRRKLAGIMIFIGIATTLLVMLFAIFAASIAFSLSLEDFRISDALRADIACFIDQSGTCTQCEAEDSTRCPEWSNEDVTRILQTQAKTGAAFAAIFAVYAVGILRYGFTLRKHIGNYQIDFV